jgi:hypothetical protein
MPHQVFEHVRIEPACITKPRSHSVSGTTLRTRLLTLPERLRSKERNVLLRRTARLVDANLPATAQPEEAARWGTQNANLQLQCAVRQANDVELMEERVLLLGNI